MRAVHTVPCIHCLVSATNEMTPLVQREEVSSSSPPPSKAVFKGCSTHHGCEQPLEISEIWSLRLCVRWLGAGSLWSLIHISCSDRPLR